MTHLSAKSFYRAAGDMPEKHNDNSWFSCDEVAAVRKAVFPFIREGVITSVFLHPANPRVLMAINDREAKPTVFWITRQNQDGVSSAYALDLPGVTRFNRINGQVNLNSILKQQLNILYPLPKPPIMLVSELT
jgi:hypothetical protein